MQNFFIGGGFKNILSRKNSQDNDKKKREPLGLVSNFAPKIHREMSNPEFATNEFDEELYSHSSYANDTEECDYIPFYHVEYQIGDPNNPQDVTEYENIVYRSMRNRENVFPECIVEQTEINGMHRGLLVDSMVRIHYKTQLTTVTLYRAVGILNRVLSLTELTKDRLQIVGCASLLIASKVEDIMPLQIESALICTNHSFSKSDLLKMETQIANLIEFDLAFPTPFFFLSYFLRINGQTNEIILLTRYILEVCLTCEEFFDVKPSAIAATSIMMMRVIIGEEPWTEELANFSQYSFDDLSGHAKSLHQILLQKNREESFFIKKKYGSEPYLGVSMIPVPKELPCPFPFV